MNPLRSEETPADGSKPISDLERKRKEMSEEELIDDILTNGFEVDPEVFKDPA